jgi:hypothetical protein
MPFFKVVIKVTRDSGDVVSPGYDTYAAFPVWCRNKECALAAALPRLNKEPELRAATDAQKPSDAFRLELVQAAQIGFREWLWGSLAPGITLVDRNNQNLSKDAPA